MRSLEDRKLLLDVVARRDAPLLSFPLSNGGHACKHDRRNSASNAAGSFGLARIPLVEKLFDSLPGTGVDSEVCRRRPVSAPDHVRDVSPQHFSPERAGIQRLLRRLVLGRMRSGERDGKIAAADQIIQFRIEMIVILIAEAGSNPSSEQISRGVGLVWKRVVP